MNRTLFSQTAMTNFAKLSVLTAVLAIYAYAGADIQSRTLEVSPQIKLELADGQQLRCAVKSWDGLGLEGSCGSIRWERFKPGLAFATLKSLVPETDLDACADAAAVVVSLDEGGIVANSAMDWARKSGVTYKRLNTIRSEAVEIKRVRTQRLIAEFTERLSQLTPEASAFPAAAWTSLHSSDAGTVSAATIEAARALLTRAGASATLHETAHVALLVESGDSALAKDAASLERFYRDWRDEFERIGATVADQGRIPVVVVSERDHWRLLVQAAFRGDAAQHPDAVVIYPLSGDPPAMRPIALVCPDSDPNRQRFNAAVGLARAVLHLTNSPVRGPAWLNEALPRVMAARAVPGAGMDGALRKRGLIAVRSKVSFTALMTSRYGEGVWASDPELAQSMSYMFARWLFDNAPDQFLRYAKGPRTSEAEAARFQRHFSMTIDVACARAAKWFQIND